MFEFMSIECVIGTIRQKFSILGSTQPWAINFVILANDQVTTLDKIYVTCALVNMNDSAVPFE